MPRQLPKCRACDGAGTLLLLKSWFITDGFRRCQCYMCDGTGRTDRNWPDLNTDQARFRGILAEQKLARAA